MNIVCKSKIMVWFVVICMLAGMFVTTGMSAEVYAADAPWTGLGTSEDPYLIEDPDDLTELSNSENMEYWGAYFEQTADITLPDVAEGESNWTPIGGNDLDDFTGTYDGCNKIIYNLTINDDSLADVGLFGAIEGIVKNLSLDNANISSIRDTTTVNIGGIAGENSGQILNCHFNGNISGAADSEVGGIAGITTAKEGSSIIQCSSSGKISGGDEAYCVGGIVGFNYTLVSDCINYAEVIADNLTGFGSVNVGGIAGSAGLVDNCYNTGNVSGGDGAYVGGLVGDPEIIIDSYNTGYVTGGDNAIIGGVAGPNYGIINSCYNTGDVTGGDNATIGGLAGSNDRYSEEGGVINNCYNTENVTGGNISDEGDYGTGGLAGINNADISDCYNTGNVVGGNVTIDEDSNLGGLVGLNDDNGEISNCYNTGNVSGANIPCEVYYSNLSVGGLAGSNTGEIDRSDSTGDVSGGNVTGGLVGSNEGTITNSNSDCNVSIINNEFVIKMVGGLAGVNDDNITDCYSKGSVRIDDSAGGYFVAGGLIGYSTGTVISCYSSCSANMSVQINEEGFAAAGGLIGQTSNETVTITDCYSSGSVGVSGTFNGLYSVGGLIGFNEQSVENCYSVGPVSNADGVTDYGGLIGYHDDDYSVAGCYYDSTTSGKNDEGKGIPKTTAEMMKQETYVGWDFINTWDIAENRGYPTLLPPVWNGDGSEENPYLVESAAHLKDVLNKIEENGGDVYFRQTADITLNTAADGESNWEPIGNDSTPFAGTYDGGGFKISNLTISDSSERYTGLFGYVENGVLNNIHLEGVKIISTGINTGSIVGFSWEGTVNNCRSDGSITGGGITGGLVGYNYGDITNSCSNFNINVDTDDNKDVGGLAGYNMGDITSSFSKGSVNVNDSGGRYVYAGGLTGGSEGTVTDCFSNCSVSLGGSIGGETVATGDWLQVTSISLQTVTAPVQ